jgi:hypothetical protein
MHIDPEEIVNGLSRWESEGGALRSEWLTNRECSGRQQEATIPAGFANALEKSDTSTKLAA